MLSLRMQVTLSQALPPVVDVAFALHTHTHPIHPAPLASPSIFEGEPESLCRSLTRSVLYLPRPSLIPSSFVAIAAGRAVSR